MRKHIVIILTLAFLLQFACGEPPKDAGEIEQPGPEGEEQPVGKPVSPDAELFLYNWGTSFIGATDTGASGQAQLIVADVASGETIAVYNISQGRQLIFSPDFSKMLFIEKDFESPSINTRVLDRQTAKEIWKTELPSPGEEWNTIYRNANWDLERDLLILDGKGFKVSQDKQEESGFSAAMSWWFLTLDLSNGEERARIYILENAPVQAPPLDAQSGVNYVAGRLYIPLPDYPVTEFGSFDRSRGDTHFNVYAIDPLTGDADKIDMRGLLGQTIEAKFFPTSDGSALFVQTQKKSEWGSPQLMGGSIQRINLETGAWELLFEYNENNAYSLRGITPGGTHLLYTHFSKSAEGDLEISHIVRNMVLGDETEIPTEGRANQLWLSPSGKYVVTFTWSRKPEIDVFEVETGNQRILDTAEGDNVPLPLKFLAGLGSGI
jgi:hypothetical protein